MAEEQVADGVGVAEAGKDELEMGHRNKMIISHSMGSRNILDKAGQHCHGQAITDFIRS